MSVTPLALDSRVTSVIDPARIPELLWDGLSIAVPPVLAQKYLARLHQEGLYAIACSRAGAAGQAGGQSQAATDQHFAHFFANSAGRTVYSTLDPAGALGSTSSILLRHSLGESFVLVDVACGAGAGSLAYLDCIRELRTAGLLPQLPLDVQIVAGDYSSRAREHLRELLSGIDSALRGAGIFVTLHDRFWDVSDGKENARFIDSVIAQCADDHPVVVLIANFNDAIVTNRLETHFEHFLSQLTGRLAVYPSSLCWIEPASNNAKRYLGPVVKFLAKFVPWLKPGVEKDFVECSYEVHDPVSTKSFPTGVCVRSCYQEKAA